MLEKADKFRSNGVFEDAYYHYWVHILLSGSSPEAYIGAIRCAFMIEKVEEILDIFLDLTSNNRNNPNVYFCIGNIFYRLGDYKEAVWHLKQAIKLDNQHVYARGNLAKVYINQGKLDKAISILKHALSISRKSGNKRAYSFIYNNLGYCFFNTGSITKAAINFKFAHFWARRFKQYIQLGYIYQNIGDLLYCTGDIGSAFDYYIKAINLFYEKHISRGSIKALAKIAMISLHTKDSKRAITLIRISMKLAESIHDNFLYTELLILEMVVKMLESKKTKINVFRNSILKRSKQLNSNSVDAILKYYSGANFRSIWSNSGNKISLTSLDSLELDSPNFNDVFSGSNIARLAMAIKDRNKILKDSNISLKVGVDAWFLLLPEIYKNSLLSEFKIRLNKDIALD